MKEPKRWKYVNPSLIPSTLYCTICSEVFFKPIRLECGHVFCKNCIKEWSKKRSDCPIDRTSLKKLSKMDTDTLSQNILNEFLVYCIYRVNGCNEILGQLEVDIHCNNCKYKEGVKENNNLIDEEGNVFVEEYITQEDAKTSLLAKLQQKTNSNTNSKFNRD